MNDAQNPDYQGEDTERGRWATEQIALTIANDGTFVDGERAAFRARDLAQAGDIAGLAAFVTNRIKTAPDFRGLRAELAANDYERINWYTVGAAVTTV